MRLLIKEIIAYCAFAILLIFTPLNAAPTVANLHASQRIDSSKMVDIEFNILHNRSVTVSIYASQDNGVTWNLPINLVSGDVGPDIDPGNGKHIVWDVLAEHPNIIYENLKFKIVADDGVADLTSGLILHYPFGGNSLDASGYGNHGVAQGNFTYVDGAINLIGSGSVGSSGGHVLLPNLSLDSMLEFSISLWVKEQSMTYEHGEAYVFFGDHSSDYVSIHHFSSNFIGDIGFYTGANVYVYTPFLSNYSNNWVHYVLVFDNGALKSYVNGVLVGVDQGQFDLTYNYAAIARHWWNGGSATSTRFNGMIDEVRIYNRALSQSEVTALYND